MPKARVLQNSMTAGVIAPTLLGRVDIAKYYNALQVGDNITLMPHGGCKRRAGTRPVLKSKDTTLPYTSTQLMFTEKTRIEPFVFNINQKYLVVINPTKITIIKDDLYLTEVALPFTLTDAQITDLDVAQYADTMIIVHPDIAPFKLVRGTTETTWTIEVIVFKNIPLYDYTKNILGIKEIFTGDGSKTSWVLIYTIPNFTVFVDGTQTNVTYDEAVGKITFSSAPANGAKIEVISGAGVDKLNAPTHSYEDVWSATRGYPATITIHQGRLFFGGTKSKPVSVIGSVINDFFDFQLGDAASDMGIFDTIASGTFDNITNIVSGRNLQVFTESGEFYNPATPITPATSAYKKQTSYGAARLGTVEIDGATFFVDRSTYSIRQFIYSFNEDAYVSPNIALMANHLIQEAKAMAVSKGAGSDIANLVYVVNNDGTMAVLNTMRLEDIQGWSRWTTDGKYLDVTVNDQTIYILVERGTGNYYIEILDDTLYLDHQITIQNSPASEVGQLTSGAFKNLGYADIRGDGLYDGNSTVVDDGSGKLTATATVPYYVMELGFNYTVVVQTVNVNAESQAGMLINKIKRLVRVKLNVYNTLGIKVENVQLTDRQFIFDFANQLIPFTGVKQVYLLGYSEHNSITITQVTPMPFTLLQIEVEVKY